MKPFPFFLSSFLLLFPSLPAVASDSPPAPLSVDGLVAEISRDHPEIRFYADELAAARLGAAAAGSRRDPELSVQAGHKRVLDSASVLAGEGTAWSVTLAQTFEWPGRLALRKAIANRDVALAELGLARLQAALASRARELAAQVWAAQEKSAAAAEVAGRFSSLRETFLARDPAGLTPLLETRVIEAQELILQRRATAVTLETEAARTELNQLRGLPSDAPMAVAPLTLAFGNAPALDTLLAAARRHHFAFRARQVELEQQGEAQQLARLERRPDLTVSPYFSHESAGERETTVGVGLSLPLPLSARSRAAPEIAAVRARQAEAALRLAEREMDREVIGAAQTFAARRAEMERWAPDAVAKFRDAAALADRHYRLGAVPLATYVELQTAYLDAVDALLDTERETLAAAAQLELLTGIELDAAPTAPRP